MRTTVASIKAGERYDVYGGRDYNGRVPPAPGAHGWLGNPFPAWMPDVMEHFDAWFHKRVREEPAYVEALERVRGKVLGCPGCRPGARCHLHVVIAHIDGDPACSCRTHSPQSVAWLQ